MDALFNGRDIPLDHFLEESNEAQERLPKAVEPHVIKMNQTTLIGEARKCVIESSYTTIEQLINRLKTR